MRKLVLLVIVLGVLVATGILTIKYSGDGTATIRFDKERAKEKTADFIEEARLLKDRIETELEHDHSDSDEMDSGETEPLFDSRATIQDEDEAP